MKILHVSMQFDYGDSRRAESYEYNHFLPSLKRLTEHVDFFDYMQLQKDLGTAQMNLKLLNLVKENDYTVAIISLYTDQLHPDTIQELRKYTTTLCFFHDDTWRREFVREWAPRFDWFTSSDAMCKSKYAAMGLTHVIYFPFGVNEQVYKPHGLEFIHDVSFVGQWHPHRAWMIQQIKRAGIAVYARGHGWPEGALPVEEVARVFSQSRINLNLSNCSSWDARYLLSSVRAIKDTLRSKKVYEQIKGRHFEIPACGGLQLSYYVDGLDACYQPGKQILFYSGVEDLIDKIGFYLKDPDQCSAIRSQAYHHTLEKHTYAQRFKETFTQMRLI
jgi:spore maturation protein CgeB